MVNFSVSDDAPENQDSDVAAATIREKGTDAPPSPSDEDQKGKRRKSGSAKDGSGVGLSTADALITVALQHFDFGIDLNGKPYGVRKGGHIAIPLVGSRRSVRKEIGGLFRRALGRTPSETALTEAVNALAYVAEERGTPTELYLRSARQGDDAIYVDMGDKAERVLRITPDGWDILDPGDDVPVLFRRTNVTSAFPTPERGGSLDPLWAFVNLRSRADRALIEGWLVAAWLLIGLPCPILAILGEQGTAKTSSARCVFALVDPSAAPVRRPPSDADRLMHAGAHSRSVIFDNLSSIPRWLSDGMCRYVTGESDVDRALYTDDDARIIQVQGVLGFTGIDVGSLAGDLAERCVWGDLEVIPARERRSERELNAAWTAAYPSMIGAVLDLAVLSLQKLPDVKLAEKPRMADFAEVLASLDLAMGTDRLSHYTQAQQSVAQEIVDTDHFLLAITATIDKRWEGTGAELYDKLPRPSDLKYWPEKRGMSGKLRRVAPDLRKAGWTVDEIVPDPATKRSKRWVLVPPGSKISDVDLAMAQFAKEMVIADIEQWRGRFIAIGATSACVDMHAEMARAGSSILCSQPGCSAAWQAGYNTLAERSKVIDAHYSDRLRGLGPAATDLDHLIAARTV